MNLKRIIASILCVCMLVLLSGCSLNFFSVESLMSPPSQSGKNGEVEAAFKKLMSDKTVQLKTPVKGDYQTSYVLYDVNNDGVEEAFVFYTDSSVDASVRIAFLEFVNDTWVISADVKGSGSTVYDLSFADLNSDGVLEVFVGWSLYENKTTKIVSVYSIKINDNGIFEFDTLANEYYSEKAFADFNGDGTDELVLVYLDDTTATQKSFFRCFSLSEKNEFVKYAELNIDSSISSVLKIQNDSVTVSDTSVSRIFIDCQKTDNKMFTEMIYWDEIKKVPIRAIKKPATSTLRSSKIFCRDIDGDGILEIPVNTVMHGDPELLTVKSENAKYDFTMLKWLNSYGDKSEGNINTVFNLLDSYLYRITRVGEVTVKYDATERTLVFCEWDEQNKEIKNELFEIAFVKKGGEEVSGSEKLNVSSNGDFYYKITEYGKGFGITDEGIISSFIIIN